MPNRRIIGTATAALFCALIFAARPAPAAPADRYLHVQVSDASKNGGDVNVNLPLSVAEKVLPTIDRGPLHQGRVTVPQDQFQGIDIPTIVEAIRTSPDSQIVSAKEKGENVQIEKSHGNIIVHVTDSGKNGQTVDVTVPISVVNALFSTAHKNELDVAAALQALDNAGDTFLVTVQGASEHVRVWIDSHNQPQ
jgi:hypothetical protein